MSNRGHFQVYFIAHWRLMLLALIFCLLFSGLGVWQLHRAEEKKLMLKAHHDLSQQAPLFWQPGESLPSQYQTIVIKGNLLPFNFLLDNQHHQHQLGYHVWTPLILGNGQVILLDRGWVAAHSNRDELPTINLLNAIRSIKGTVYYPSNKNWLLGSVFDKREETSAVIEAFDTRILGQFLHKSVYPFIIRMDPAEADGFVREWTIVSMSPERHLAYAVQWFALALLVIILWISLTIKKKI